MKNLQLIFTLSKDDFKKRFIGSYFGVLWMFIQPVVTILIYTFIFQVGFKSVPPIPGIPYVLWLIPGITPWFFFQEAWVHETNSLIEYSFLVKKVVFNVSFLPIIKLFSAILVHLCFVIIMLIVFFIGRQPFRFSYIYIFYFTFCCSILALGLGFWTSAICVFFRDMMQIVGIAIQFGIWLCPIMYDESMFIDRAPFVIRLLKFNPFYYIVKGYRFALLGDVMQNPLKLTLYFWCIALFVLFTGYKVFNKLRPHFADVL